MHLYTQLSSLAMWLLNTETLRLEMLNDTEAQKLSYATLSHVWGEEEEVTFLEVSEAVPAARGKVGWSKLSDFCT